MKLARFHLFLACTSLTLLIAVRAANVNIERDDAPRLSDPQLSNMVSCPKKSAHILLPHPTDCGKFFTCDHGVAHPTSCQTGLHFNAKVQECDYPETAGCKSDVSEVLQEKDGGEKDNALCPAEKTKHPVYRPHPTDCGKFYVCDGGKPHLKVCQKGLHFNQKIQTCDYPRNAGCNSKMVTENPREGTGGCPPVNNGNPVYLSHKTDCRKFYVCDTGVPHLKLCQAGLHFNPKVNACDYPANSGCEKDGRLLGVGKPSPLCPTTEDKDPFFYRHPGNCSVFFMCSHGFAYEFQCPARLHFNLKLKMCDYEEATNCPAAIRFYERIKRRKPIGQFEWGDFVKQYACFFCKEEQINYSLDYHLVN